jgi:hypothetical protein
VQNPKYDPTRDQYFDFVERTERSLKLVGQPRAIVFHTKNGRQHRHVVWSRIYPDDSKAVQIDHDRYKLQPSYLLEGAQPLVPRRIPWFCPRTFSS